MAINDRIFTAVFPPPSDVDIPTPAATPVLGSSGFAETLSSQSFSQLVNETGAASQIKWDNAWHTATTFLSLSDEPIRAEDDEQTLEHKWIKPHTTEIQKALEFVTSRDSSGRQLQNGERNDDLLRWYFEEQVIEHFVKQVLPGLVKILNEKQVPGALFEVGRQLHIVQLIYSHPLGEHVCELLATEKNTKLDHFQTDLRNVFTHTLPQIKVAENLASFFKQQSSKVLNEAEEDRVRTAPSSILGARRETVKRMQALQSVGLGGYEAQRTLAEVMCDVLSLHIKATYSGKWTSPSTIPQQLREWIEDDFARFIVEVLNSMKEGTDHATDELTEVTLADVEKWQQMGVSRLGALRTDEMFNVIVEWENGSQGAIEDLKGYITSPPSRTYLTNTFSSVLCHRLLQPGASTNEILQVYISIIRAFTLLDPKGVLLDRVARPIRRYLRERDDTVTIVVGGLLADPEDESSMGDVLVELASEMNMSTSLKGEDDADDGELDFDDMTWLPDPVDAGPEYRKSKNSDVIGSLISLFESKEIFVKEFQKILGERLLKKEYEFDREIRVLELLKLRFGEAALQACEVMLRDIIDSRRVNSFIHRNSNFAPSTSTMTPALHTRILSHLFWPSLHSETFLLPPEIMTLQINYATAFSALKASRKITYLHALGQVTVTLDLEDRTVTEEVQTWQASVIHAFQPLPSEQQQEQTTTPVTRTVPYLVETLEMAEPLVLNALTFWVGKLVLRALHRESNKPQTYIVLETLASEDAAHPGTTSAAIAAAAETATSAAAPAVLSEHEVAQEKMEVYAQYVVGMLTNGGAMPLQQIVMMLKLTVPGGFPFGNEELKGYLEGEVRGGRLDFQGGSYRIRH